MLGLWAVIGNIKWLRRAGKPSSGQRVCDSAYLNTSIKKKFYQVLPKLVGNNVTRVNVLVIPLLKIMKIFHCIFYIVLDFKLPSVLSWDKCLGRAVYKCLK